MNSPRLQTVVASIGFVAAVSVGCVARDAHPQTVQTTPAVPLLSQPQLDELVAPVALYADPLLADVLTASTYPLEIVVAERWLAIPANAALKGDALAASLMAQDWDPSVKALVPFPQILRMLDRNLDWTQHLGEAFLAQQADVMDAAQRLRHRAETAGTLKSSPQETVASDADIVTISPPASAVIYVPAYNPWCVYGAWPYPFSPPLDFAPDSGDCGAGIYGMAFGVGIGLPFGYWEWGSFDWRRHNIRIDHDRFGRFHSGHDQGGDVWHHDTAHRGGVPYRNANNAGQFQAGKDYHQSFRGYQGRDGEQSQPARRTPPAFESFGSGRDVGVQSQRGQASRQGMSGGSHATAGGGRGGGGAGAGRR